MRFPRLLAGLGLAVLTGIAGTACTTHAGAAAQVGSSTIETSTLRDIVDRGFEAAAALPDGQGTARLDRAELQRRALSTLVQLELLENEADRLGVSVSSQEVSSYYQAYGVLLYGGVEQFEQQAAAAGFAKEDIQTIVLSSALESAIADKIAPDLLASEEDAETAYEATVSQFGEIPLSFEQARPYLQRFLSFEERAAKTRPLLTEAAEREHVSINPRFGEWDSNQFAVIPADGTIATTPEPASVVDLSLQS